MANFLTDATFAGTIDSGAVTSTGIIKSNTAEAQFKLTSTHGRETVLGQGGGNFHILPDHGSGVGISYGNTTYPGLLRLYNNTTAKITLDATAGNATFAGKITATGDPGVLVTGSDISTVKIASTGTGLAGMYMDASNGDFVGSDYVFIGQDNDKTFRLESFSSSGDILLKESNTNTLRLSGGNATFAGTITIPDYIVHNGDTNTKFGFGGNDSFQVNTSGAIALGIDTVGDATFAGNATFNGATVVFNPDADSSLLIGNAGTDAIAIFAGTGDTLYLGGNNTTGLYLDTAASAVFSGALHIPEYIYHSGDTNTYIRFTADTQTFTTGGTDRLTLTNTTSTFAGDVAVTNILHIDGAATGNPYIDWRQGGSQRAYIQYVDTGDIFDLSSDGQIRFKTNGENAALTLDTSQNATFAGNITFPTGYLSDYIYHTGDTNTYFGFNANDQFRVNCAGNTKLNVTSTQINTYSAEITTSGSPQYFTYGGSGSHTLVFRENGPGGYKNSIIASAGGGVQLFYNNSEKLVTQSGGVSLGNNSLFLGQYSAINLNGVGPSAGKVITGTGSSTQLTWNDSVSNITVGTGLDISSSTSNGAITKNLTLDFNELPVIDGDDPQADWFIVESSEDENSKISRSDLQSVDAHWKTFQTVINSNFDDRSSSTSIFYMPLNYISETTSANYYNTFACPRGGTVKRIMMMHTAGSTMSSSFTTELSLLKNGLSTLFSGELTPSNGTNDGSNITWSPNYTFTAGDRLNFRYQKSGTSKYWYGVSVSIIIEFDTI